MSEPIDPSRSESPVADDGVGALRSGAERVASGLRMLRWALIVTLVDGLVVSVGKSEIAFSGLRIGSAGWMSSMLALETIGWVVAPLVLIGIVRILRVRPWTVPRWLVTVLVSYVAVRCIWNPLASVYWLVSVSGDMDGSVRSIGVVREILGLLLSVAFIIALFAGYFLARAVDRAFGRALISALHCRWLLWLGVIGHGLSVLWWVTLRYWDPIARIPDLTDVASGMIEGSILMLVSLPGLIWLIWLLVVAFRIGKRLKRFIRLHRCLRCGYDLRGEVASGCPECGWQRARSARDR